MPLSTPIIKVGDLVTVHFIFQGDKQTRIEGCRVLCTPGSITDGPPGMPDQEDPPIDCWILLDPENNLRILQTFVEIVKRLNPTELIGVNAFLAEHE